MTRLRKLRKEVNKFADDRRWGKYHTPKNLAMSVAIEAAELMEIFQWKTPAESLKLSPKEKAHLSEELADVFLYLVRLGDRFDIDLIEAANSKIKKNAVKYPKGRARLR
jgi:NTP pyrophosphatase (non-canonical NTP hydrolase)